MAIPAFADTEISVEQKGPVNTTTDANITIDQTIILHDNKPGAVAIINSDNTITNNAGLISNKSKKDALVVELNGGGPDAGLTSTGGITAEGLGANNVGIQVDAAGFTGSINLSNDSTSQVVVDGTNPIGLNILGTLNGNITTGAPITASGNVATSAFVNGLINGSFTNTGTLSAVGLDQKKLSTTMATAVHFGSTGSLALLTNGGTISASITGKTSTDTAIGIAADAGAHLLSVTNSGTISATVRTSSKTATETVYAIQDLSGNLTNITNTGTITTSLTQLDNGGLPTIAIDLSGGSQAATFITSGTVNGDVLFGGNANNVLSVQGGSVTGRVLPATGGGVAASITGGELTTREARFSSLSVGANGTLGFVIGQTTPSPAVVTVTGAANFASGSHLALSFDSGLTLSGSATLLNAGSLTLANTSTLNAALPFIYTGSVSQTGNSLVFTFQRKNAAALGLSKNATELFEPAINATANDAVFGAALLNLSSQGAVQSAMERLEPVTLSGMTNVVAGSLTQQSLSAVGAHQRMLTELSDTSHEGMNWWGQEVYNNLRQSAVTDVPGDNQIVEGFAFGTDSNVSQNIRLGGAFTWAESGASGENPAQENVYGTWLLPTIYANYRDGDYFLNGQGTVGFASLNSKRRIKIDTLVRDAKGNWDEYLGAAGISTGFVATAGTFSAIPRLDLDGLFDHGGTYSESGASGEDLNVASRDSTSITGFAGLSLLDSIDAGDGTFLVPELRGGYGYDLLRADRKASGSFAAIPGSGGSFSLSAEDPSSSRLVGGGGLSYRSSNWALHFDYDFEDGKGTMIHTGTISLEGYL